MIYKDVTNILIDTLKRFKGVKYVKYTGDDLINQQNNNPYLQCWVDNISFHQFNLTTNIVKAEYQIYILGFADGTSGNTVLDIQDKCYDVAIYTLAAIDTNSVYNGIVSVYDYSILTLDRKSDDNSAGVKLSVTLSIPNGVDICEIDNMFGEPYKPEPDKEIDIDVTDVGDITLKPITLPKNNRC